MEIKEAIEKIENIFAQFDMDEQMELIKTSALLNNIWRMGANEYRQNCISQIQTNDEEIHYKAKVLSTKILEWCCQRSIDVTNKNYPTELIENFIKNEIKNLM